MIITPDFYNSSIYDDIPDNETIPGIPLPIHIYFFDTGLKFDTGYAFVYKPDPVVNDFYPKDTIVE